MKNSISNEEWQDLDQKRADATYKKIKKAINALKWKDIKNDYFDGVIDILDEYTDASEEEIVKDFFTYLLASCV